MSRKLMGKFIQEGIFGNLKLFNISENLLLVIAEQ